MANIIESLVVQLLLDSSDFAAGLDEGNKKLQGMGDRLKETGTKVRNFGAGLTAGVTTPILLMANTSVDAASDLSESMSKVGVVFGENAAEVEAWAETAAKALGQSEQQALEAAGTFGNLFTSMGMGQDAAADMSTEIVELASDIASFNNIDPTIALEKLRAGLLGEIEPLRSVGVNLSAVAVEAKALQMGLVDMEVDMVKVNRATLNLEKANTAARQALQEHGKESLQFREAQQKVAEAEAALEKAMAGSKIELNAAQKAQAAYALILEQTTNAQGDFARTSEGLANQQRIANALWQDAQAQIGEKLLPIKLKLIEIISSLLERYNSLSPAQQDLIIKLGAIAAAVGPVLIVVGTLITTVGTLMSALTAIGPVFTAITAAIAALGGPITIIIAAVGALALAWSQNWFDIQGKTRAAWENIKRLTQDGINAIRGFFAGGWYEVGQRMIQGIVDGIRSAWTWVTDAARSVAQSALNAAKGALGIESPSREGVKLGINFGESIGTGARAAMGAVVRDVADGLRGALSDVELRAGGMRTTNNSISISMPLTIGAGADVHMVSGAVKSGTLAALRQVGYA